MKYKVCKEIKVYNYYNSICNLGLYYCMILILVIILYEVLLLNKNCLFVNGDNFKCEYVIIL